MCHWKLAHPSMPLVVIFHPLCAIAVSFDVTFVVSHHGPLTSVVEGKISLSSASLVAAVPGAIAMGPGQRERLLRPPARRRHGRSRFAPWPSHVGCLRALPWPIPVPRLLAQSPRLSCPACRIDNARMAGWLGISRTCNVQRLIRNGSSP